MWGAAIGLVGSLVGAASQKKAANRYADQLLAANNKRYAQTKELADPMIRAGNYGTDATKSILSSQIMPSMGKDDPYLTAERDKSLSTIGQNTARTKAGIDQVYGSTGNQGAKRGETLMANRADINAKNDLGLKYGEAQTKYKDSRMSLALDGLAGLRQTGAQGVSLMSGAINNAQISDTNAIGLKQAGSDQFYSDLGSLAGIPIGTYLDQLAAKRTPKTAGVK